MKKIAYMALSTLFAVSLFSPGKTVDAKSFIDVKDDKFYKEAVDKLSDEGIINGYKDETFRPHQPIKRGEAAVLLSTALDLEESKRPSPDFPDVDEEHYIYDAVAAVADEGLIQGFKNGKYMPQKPLTRAEMAQILQVAYELEGDSGVSFTDVKENSWMFEPIQVLAANGIAKGYGSNQFQPNKPVTRGEAAVFLERTMNVSLDDDGKEYEYDEELASLLQETFEKQLHAESFSFDGTVNMTFDLPMPADTPDVPEGFPVTGPQEMNLDIRGAYEEDPLFIETIMTTTLPAPTNESITDVSLFTEDALYSYITDTEMVGYPEEWEGKYLETSFNGGESDADMVFDWQSQKELSAELNQKILTELGTAHIDIVEENDIVPAHVDYEYLVKTEIDNEDLDDVVRLVEEHLLPEMEDMFAEPMLEEPTNDFSGDADGQSDVMAGDVEELKQNLTIETFETYQAINEDRYIPFEAGTVDISVDLDNGETMSFAMDYKINSSNFNEEIDFEYGLPQEEEIITEEEFLEWQNEWFENIANNGSIKRDEEAIE